MTSPEVQGRTFSENKYELQNRLMQHVFALTDTELEAMTQGENDKDPRLAKMLEWIEGHAAAISDAITETPEALREEIFATLYTDNEAAVERFLSVHPELRGEEETLH